jgi:hypothetical protein
VRTGQDFHQSYSISWGEAQLNFVHTSDILIYRGDEPPCFVSDSGKSYVLPLGKARSNVRIHGADTSKLRPGFQVACSVSANLRAAFEAARPRMGSQGQTFRDVSVSYPLYWFRCFNIDTFTSSIYVLISERPN